MINVEYSLLLCMYVCITIVIGSAKSDLVRSYIYVSVLYCV